MVNYQLFSQDDHKVDLMLHLDASNIRDVGSGDTVEIWNDLSGNGNDATRNTGSPYLDADAINGMPAVYFNGNSQIDAPPYIGSSYSVVAVVQADGIRNGRLLATDDDSKNWFMGYHGGYEDVFHPGTWRTNRTIRVTKSPDSTRLPVRVTTKCISMLMALS